MAVEKAKIVAVHIMKSGRGVKVHLHSFLTLVLEVVKWAALWPGHITPSSQCVGGWGNPDFRFKKATPTSDRKKHIKCTRIQIYLFIYFFPTMVCLVVITCINCVCVCVCENMKCHLTGPRHTAGQKMWDISQNLLFPRFGCMFRKLCIHLITKLFINRCKV